MSFNVELVHGLLVDLRGGILPGLDSSILLVLQPHHQEVLVPCRFHCSKHESDAADESTVVEDRDALLFFT